MNEQDMRLQAVLQEMEIIEASVGLWQECLVSSTGEIRHETFLRNLYHRPGYLELLRQREILKQEIELFRKGGLDVE